MLGDQLLKEMKGQLNNAIKFHHQKINNTHLFVTCFQNATSSRALRSQAEKTSEMVRIIISP
jgi:hypothetical protein